MLLNIVRERKRLAIETLHVLIKLIVNVSKDCLTFILSSSTEIWKNKKSDGKGCLHTCASEHTVYKGVWKLMEA